MPVDRELRDALERRYGPDWRTGPPVAERDLEAFEALHGARLPEEYRTFVLTEATGAVGPPENGLVRLGARSHPSEGEAIAVGSIARPFPLTEAWVWAGEAGVSVDDPRVASTHEDGVLPLGTDGDGMDWMLVVTGPARGQVWLVTDVGAVPVARNFRAWLLGEVLPDAEWARPQG